MQPCQQASAADAFYLRKLAQGKNAHYVRKMILLSRKVTESCTQTQKERHILSSFYRPVLTLYVLGPALAGGLINWPFHLVDVHCVSGFVCIWICECMHSYVCVCMHVCLGTLSELWSVWLPHWGLLSQPLKACNRRPFCRNEYTSIH